MVKDYVSGCSGVYETGWLSLMIRFALPLTCYVTCMAAIIDFSNVASMRTARMRRQSNEIRNHHMAGILDLPNMAALESQGDLQSMKQHHNQVP